MAEESKNFIEQIIEGDIRKGKHGGAVRTRFPPEPNGYLHIGHAKAICLNFDMGQKYNGTTNLRFDDTNPATEEEHFVENIKKDIHWLGYDWDERLYFASDYFQELYEYALQLIEQGDAYVDDSSAEEIGQQKGTVTTPGINSPFRGRSIEENRDLFIRMKEGEFEEGSRVLRARIDMAHPNMNMRDPLIYRIKQTPHHQSGSTWNIYPMYDFAHPVSDSIENITHSLCTLEFENHRPIYDWFLEKLGTFPSRQIEFARLNVNYMITSKRRLRRLVEEGHVRGWDDPRMPTISGLRRRGFSPESIRTFARSVGVAKRDNVIDISLLEHCLRDDLNTRANRMMAILDPLKIVITNYPEGQVEWMEAENNPENESAGIRQMPFSRELYIEREDFMENPPKKYFRMTPGEYVRLKHGYILMCEKAVKDSEGNVTEVHCTFVENSKSGEDTSGIKVKGTLHYVEASHATEVEVRLYDRLFNVPIPDADPEVDFITHINPNSENVLTRVMIEPELAKAQPGEYFQFFRKGYFVLDPDSTEERLIFNQSVALRDSWAKLQQKK